MSYSLSNNFDPTCCVLGLEFGSTRIKAVLLDDSYSPVASGSYEWENKLENGIWTYSLDSAISGLQECYKDLKNNTESLFGKKITSLKAIGISGMMHGFLPFDAEGNQLTEFRTWRNTMTGPAADKLSELFHFNIPQRWSIAHLYQAILNEEPYLNRLDYITTLSGYIHYLLTGLRIIGIGEASGMFPIDSSIYNYDKNMLEQFNKLLTEYNYTWKISDILPKVLRAGEPAGVLTKEGALLLDPSGELQRGIPFAPCEGDAGTGMIATNAVRPGTGNVSAGTSGFAMFVTDRPLGIRREIDMVTTPSGFPVAMIHTNNCTSDINAWVSLFGECLDRAGFSISKNDLFTMLFRIALEGDPDCGSLISYNYISGEGITNLNDGRPLFLRTPNSTFTLANFMRAQLFSSIATLRLGMDILLSEEKYPIKQIYAHGGYFRTPEVGQRILSAVFGIPVTVMKTADEGGAYGMALLASYMLNKRENESLEDFLDNKVLIDSESITLEATEEEKAGFDMFFNRYKQALSVEKLAIKVS